MRWANESLQRIRSQPVGPVHPGARAFPQANGPHARASLVSVPIHRVVVLGGVPLLSVRSPGRCRTSGWQPGSSGIWSARTPPRFRPSNPRGRPRSRASGAGMAFATTSRGEVRQWMLPDHEALTRVVHQECAFTSNGLRYRLLPGRLRPTTTRSGGTARTPCHRPLPRRGVRGRPVTGGHSRVGGRLEDLPDAASGHHDQAPGCAPTVMLAFADNVQGHPRTLPLTSTADPVRPRARSRQYPGPGPRTRPSPSDLRAGGVPAWAMRSRRCPPSRVRAISPARLRSNWCPSRRGRADCPGSLRHQHLTAAKSRQRRPPGCPGGDRPGNRLSASAAAKPPCAPCVDPAEILDLVTTSTRYQPPSSVDRRGTCDTRPDDDDIGGQRPQVQGPAAWWPVSSSSSECHSDIVQQPRLPLVARRPAAWPSLRGRSREVRGTQLKVVQVHPGEFPAPRQAPRRPGLRIQRRGRPQPERAGWPTRSGAARTQIDVAAGPR